MSEGLLSAEDREAGFSLWEDDHCIYVSRWGKEVAVFSSSGMTRASLRQFLDQEKARRGGAITPASPTKGVS